MTEVNTYTVLGIMSGTSLDGLDLALCSFQKEDESWSFKIIKAQTYEYDSVWREKLGQCSLLSSFDLLQLDKNFGFYIGKKVNAFLKNTKYKPDLIASHGHTVFHQPEKGITMQIGSGELIAANCGIQTISDFRSLDVALGGQGAPLVPIGDQKLFSEFDYCLNLGGFSNISFNEKGKRLAYDICPVNIAINKLYPPFDADGLAGRSGILNKKLLYELNSLSYYSMPYPKSLGREWFEGKFFPIFHAYDIPTEDKLRTLYEHIAMKVKMAVSNNMEGSMLITGGGTHNAFLVELIAEKFQGQISIPELEIIEFKEALIFAFLGVLRLRNEINTLASVTGAKADSSGGLIYLHQFGTSDNL
ncbi:MAG: anhydro-N-acetylmuramic acid kinase [Bacteroidetes bacterium]|nr:anhydro-N-acetylmuramic acid kinase [Bacteroidota bacterium]MBT5528138.1 anhydro-N-acetylmuramic acid kinase [Cytophagia bacterium]MBT3935502.1 anhydro-N-acetylmuramic acid kinase [Bacteroidota bacterium]MBT4339676.1 anhydro-N-acetylmuramic acid kinase [Bacteroidota bacterium]MBT4728174.1 anhydro-N-acetylmuramic acid kinase [Bacteroidota bacterium]